VQLADFKAEKSEPGDSDWAELRESQTHLYRRKQGLDKIGFHIDGMLILDAQ
jgi:hypothetical protein